MNVNGQNFFQGGSMYCHDCKCDRDTVIEPIAIVKTERDPNDRNKVNFTVRGKRTCSLCGGDRLGLSVTIEIKL